MFYHAMIEIPEKKGKTTYNQQIFELDKTELSEIVDDVVVPYLKGQEFQFDGYFIKPGSVARLVVKKTSESVKVHAAYANDHMSPDIIFFIKPSDILSYEKYATDITKDAMAMGKDKMSESSPTAARTIPAASLDKSKVFVVHGHDDLAKTRLLGL